MKRLVLAWLALVLVLSCAARPSQYSSTSHDPTPRAQTWPGDYREQIEQLDREIGIEREKLNLPEPHPQDDCPDCPRAQMVGAVPHKNDPQCHPAQNDACQSSCTLSDSICNNADKICDLSTRYLPGDKWAADKCSTANQTCKQARERCCACQ